MIPLGRPTVTRRQRFAFSVKALHLSACDHMEDEARPDVHSARAEVMQDVLSMESMFAFCRPRSIPSQSLRSAIAARIQQLGGTVQLGAEPDATRVVRAHRRGQNLHQAIAEELMAAHIAGDSCAVISRWLASRHDLGSQRLVEEMRVNLRMHADELHRLLEDSDHVRAKVMGLK